MWPMNRTETTVVFVFTAVFGGSLFCASELFGWGDVWSPLFAFAMTAASMGVMYVWAGVRRTVYVSKLRPRSGSQSEFCDSNYWIMEDWFYRRN